jgi:hypothetical protein
VSLLRLKGSRIFYFINSCDIHVSIIIQKVASSLRQCGVTNYSTHIGCVVMSVIIVVGDEPARALKTTSQAMAKPLCFVVKLYFLFATHETLPPCPSSVLHRKYCRHASFNASFQHNVSRETTSHEESSTVLFGIR